MRQAWYLHLSTTAGWMVAINYWRLLKIVHGAQRQDSADGRQRKREKEEKCWLLSSQSAPVSFRRAQLSSVCVLGGAGCGASAVSSRAGTAQTDSSGLKHCGLCRDAFKCGKHKSITQCVCFKRYAAPLCFQSHGECACVRLPWVIPPQGRWIWIVHRD